MAHTAYRPDIDGLRAVAVLAVLFSHAGFEFVSGGFVGVDIFFVISGFLITKILYSEVKQNTFSIKSFYQRRIRRILPAFYLVSVITVAVGSILMLPADFDDLVNSFIASSFFLANVFFMGATGGYFSDMAHEMPLLHMWSLSVEEQFYLFWPLLLLVLVRRISGNTMLVVIGSLIVVSFGAAEYWLSTGASQVAYYSIIARAGELLLGALLAVSPNRDALLTPKRAQIISLLGLLLIFSSILLIDEGSRFPGLHAFWPCLGAVLLIWSGSYQGSIGARLLSIRPMVFIGLISYSLYLWHWPLLAFTRYMRYEISTLMGLGFVLASICLAYLSWKYVEQPFRRKNPSKKLRTIKNAFALTALTTMMIAIASHYDLVSIQSFDEERYQSAQKTIVFPSLRNGWCHIDSEDGFNRPFEQRYLNCQYGSVSANSRALLWGDSHAAGYAPFLDDLGKELGFNIVEMSTSACEPTLAPIPNNKWRFQVPICNGFRAEAIKNIKNDEYDFVFIAARWEEYSENMEGSIQEAISFAAQHSKGVFVFAQVPRFDLNIGDCYVRGKMLPLSNGCDEGDTYEVAADVSRANEYLQTIIEKIPNAQIVDVGELICNNGSCNPFIEKKPAYFDENHLNIEGSRALAKLYFASRSGQAFSETIRKSEMIEESRASSQ
jgi:peptidoglycan/LPS O-acetylase OafA/YrhL